MKKEGMMKTRKYLIVTTAIFVAVLFCSCDIAPYNVAEYYPLTQGDKRIFTYTAIAVGGPLDGLNVTREDTWEVNGTEVVNGVETIKQTFKNPTMEEPNYYCWVIDSDGLKYHKMHFEMFGMYHIHEKPMMVFPTRFDVGDVYEGPYSYSEYSIEDDTLLRTYEGNQTITFVSVEDVTVPAGTFKDCLKISASGSTQSEDGTIEFEETKWLAHNVGLIKREETVHTSPLTEEDWEFTVIEDLISYNVSE